MVLTPSEFELLNLVVLKKMLARSLVTELASGDEAAVQEASRKLVQSGLVAEVGDALMPTDEAEAALTAFTSVAYADLRASSDADRLHDRFESINGRFLQAMSSWQQVDIAGKKVTNDHSDPVYDQGVIDTLAKLISRFVTVVENLAGHDPRFAAYAVRIEDALARVDAGDTSYVASPLVDSIHNIWFEFHEDLLRTLGRSRRE